MNVNRFFPCITFVLAIIGLAEGWLIAAGVTAMPVADHISVSGAKGNPDCNKSDISNPNCETRKDVEPGQSCTTTYPVYSTTAGENLDHYEDPNKTKDRCTGNYCVTKTVQESTASPYCKLVIEEVTDP